MMRVRELQGLVNQPLSLHMALRVIPERKTTCTLFWGSPLFCWSVETPTLWKCHGAT